MAKPLFIWVPRTGGRTVTKALHLDVDEVYGHTTLRHHALHLKDFESRDVFAFVRNPYDRFLSAYNWVTDHGNARYPDLSLFAASCCKFSDPQEGLQRFIQGFDSRWLKEVNLFRPQTYFLCLSESNRPPKSLMYYSFEHYEKHIKDLITGLQREEVKDLIPSPFTRPYTNQTSHPPWIDIYSVRMKRQIEEWYPLDDQLLTYPSLPIPFDVGITLHN